MLSLLITTLLAVSGFAAPNSDGHHEVDIKRAASGTVIPAGWTAVGCFTDDISMRTLRAASTSIPSLMSLNVCADFCSHKFGVFAYAGVEFGQECFCDNTINAPGIQTESGCDMACVGDITQSCGGPNRIFIAHRNA